MSVIPAGLLSAVGDRYGVLAEGAEALGGGTASLVWRLDSEPSIVVRMSQYYQLENLQQSCRIATEFARLVPEAVQPLVGFDGGAAFYWDGQPVTVWPYVAGLPLDRGDLVQVRQAAGLLARMHGAALASPGLGTGQAPDRDDAEAVRLFPDTELDDWLRSWRASDAVNEQVGWMHRDFFPGNLIYRDGKVVGLVDWDEVEWGPLINELAYSLWEFGKSPSGEALLLDRAMEFLSAYQRAGGPVQPSEALIPLIRDRLRRSIAFWRRVRAEGHEVDPAAEPVSAFESLRHVRLPL